MARRNTGRPAGRPTSAPPKRALTTPEGEAVEASTSPAEDNKGPWTQVTHRGRNTAAKRSQSVRPPTRKNSAIFEISDEDNPGQIKMVSAEVYQAHRIKKGKRAR